MSKDLFDESTMTFGEHLEVLRTHLIKALIGLVLGVLLALTFSQKVIHWIQVPVIAAMERHFLIPTDLEVFVPTSKNDEKSPEKAPQTPPQGKAEAKPGPAASSDAAVQTRLPTLENIPGRPDLAPQQTYTFSIDVIKIASELNKIDPKAYPAPPTGAKPVMLPVTLAKNDLNRLINLVNREQILPRTDNVDEAFMMYMKVSLITGLVISSPWVLFQIWLFVAAGLYPHERKYVYTYLPMSVGLFLGGALFCFFAVIPYVLDFLFSFNTWLHLRPEMKIAGWISFALMLSLMFGVSFQLPLVMLFLERISIFSGHDYRSKRRMAILVISVVSMVLTPSDPMSMMLMMVPLCFLYELGILLCGNSVKVSPFQAQAA